MAKTYRLNLPNRFANGMMRRLLGASDEQIAAEAPHHPVFRIVSSEAGS